MDRGKVSAQVERLDVVEFGRRRRWTAAAKRRIVEESLAGHGQASATARRYGISASLLFAWRRAYRGSELAGMQRHGFVPAIMVEDEPAPRSSRTGRLEILTGNGYRVIVDAGVDEAALFKVLAVLARS